MRLVELKFNTRKQAIAANFIAQELVTWLVDKSQHNDTAVTLRDKKSYVSLY